LIEMMPPDNSCIYIWQSYARAPAGTNGDAKTSCPINLGAMNVNTLAFDLC